MVLIPSALPPHKLRAGDLAPAEDRLEMCRLAVAGDPMFEVSDVELVREGPSYTIDTVRGFRTQGWKHVAWLIGADVIPLLPDWHQPDDLLREVEWVVMERSGCRIDWGRLPERYRRLEANLVEAPLIDVSASAIRRRIAEGRSPRYLTPDAVCDYIAAHGLYRGNPAG